MARVTRTIYAKVLTFDPAQGQMIPVPGARLKIKQPGLFRPDLTSQEYTTDATGVAEIEIGFEENDSANLNPYFTITVPEAQRLVPAGAAADRQLRLPASWETPHAELRRLNQITHFSDRTRPLEIYIGLKSELRLAYSDFDQSGKRNPLALPEDTARVYLADYDVFLFDFLDFLNPDDTMTGFGLDPRQNRTIAVGNNDHYPYFDRFPIVPEAMNLPASPEAPQAWRDPPGLPVGMLGGDSFEEVGTLVTDSQGYVFMVDGTVIRRFYPDGTLCETINAPTPFSNPQGIAIDQHGHLFVADAGRDRISIFRPAWRNGSGDRYQHVRDVDTLSIGITIDAPHGLAVVPHRVVDSPELLLVANSGQHQVLCFEISLRGDANRSHRASPSLTVQLGYRSSFGSSGTNPDQFQNPVGLVADRQGQVWVCDRQLHRVSRWVFNAARTTCNHQVTWEKAGQVAGNGNGEFNTPVAIALDLTQRYLYVLETGNHRVQILDADTGNTLQQWQPQIAGAAANLVALAVDSRGEIYLADGTHKRVQRFSPYAANGDLQAAAMAPRTIGTAWTARTDTAHLHQPGYVLFDAAGQLWVSDTGNHRVLVFQRNAGGELQLNTTVGTPAADLQRPIGLAFDAEGSLYVVDSDHHRIRKYQGTPLAYVAPDLGTGTAGATNQQFNHPCGIALVQRNEPLLYVADRDNNRVQVIRRDGSYVKTLSLPAGDSFDHPEDVAVDATGNIFVADTGNHRVVRFNPDDGYVQQFVVPSPAGLAAGVRPAPSGISVDDDGKLIVCDRTRNCVFRLEPDGTLLAFWDLKVLLRQDANRNYFYEPHLARELLLHQPSRAVVDAQGMMAIADTGQHRIRLVGTYTDLQVNLLELGQGLFDPLPDISLRLQMKADWHHTLGLRLNVGNLNIFDDSHDFESRPVENYSQDTFRRYQLLTSERSSNSAINVMRVVKQVQRWYQHQTRQDEADHRWGNPSRSRTLDVDLISGEGSWMLLDVNLGEGSSHGRRSDAWDEDVIAHEMTHWVFFKALQPYPPFTLAGFIQLAANHSASQVLTFNHALSEGWANFVRLQWGYEYGGTSSVRGFALIFRNQPQLTGLIQNGQRQYLFGGSESTALPTFEDKEKGLRNEGYIANGLYQIHKAMTNPDVLFADASSYWYPFNSNINDTQSRRFSHTIWRALRMFDADPPMEDLDRGSVVYFRNVLRAFQNNQPAFAQIAQSIYELNNLLMPVITISEGTSETTPGSPIHQPVNLANLGIKSFIVRVTDAGGRPLVGYNVNITRSAALVDLSLSAVSSEPVRQHGRVMTEGMNRATNANGIVNFSVEALPLSGGQSVTVTVTYQPDFDTDVTFAPPSKGANREAMLRQLYLYELRAAAKTWSGNGNNWGAKVTQSLNLSIQTS